MATRDVQETDAARDPLVAFYAGLGRLAADEGEFTAASVAYRKAVIFAGLTARRRESRRVIPGDRVRFDPVGASVSR